MNIEELKTIDQELKAQWLSSAGVAVNSPASSGPYSGQHCD